ncbi:MAG TPA: lysylphosphatidylglycerol synthetase family protein [Prolixibacteraceae bacterium]|jgi:phosphatidylglycerol lysyltransferase|nr:lysylphosphatidylglycerol synthetase family protein [Prolixibacteraceae bacterium]
MQKAKTFISNIFHNKFSWQLILAASMIGMAVFFISQEHLEVIQIRRQLLESNPWYVFLGIVLTIVYILLQGLMYVHSFRALGNKIPLMVAVRLFLKRNLVSVFLPAGGFSSLLFFTNEIKSEKATKSQIHLASTLFAIIGILSVVVVAIPILGYAMLAYDLRQTELLGFGFLLLLSSSFIYFIFSISKKGKTYRWLSKIKPSMAIILDEMIEQKIDRKEVLKTLAVSTVIEFIGIIHLYVAMRALGFDASWPAAFIGYIVMVILLIASPFLRGLGAIEVSLTYILGQFGFPLLAAATITLLYRFFEFWLPLLGGLISFITKKDNVILRILPAIIIFILGVVNIISSVTPAIPTRLHVMESLIPEDIITTSNGFVLVSGLLLVILSVFLLQGSKRSWYIGLVITVLSFVGHLLKGADYEEAIIAFIAFSSLLYTRRLYQLRPHPKFTRISYLVLVYSVIALLAFGATGFYFIEKRHFGIDFSLWQSVKTIFRLFFLFDDSGLEPKTVFAQNFIYTIYASGGLVLSFIFFSLLKPYFTSPYNTEEDRELAQSIIEKYGNSPLDYFKTYPDKFFFFSENREGFISFKVTRHFAIVLENPVCKDEEMMIRLIKDFDQFCEENGFVSVYYRVPQQSLESYKKLGKKSLPVGEEAIVDLTTFSLEGGKMKPTRNALNRLTSDGYETKIYTAPIKEGLLQKLEQVSNDWLEGLNRKEIAFSQGVFDSGILKNQTIITLEDKEEKVYAFLNIIPDYAAGEATYDMVRKSCDAPHGVLDMLMVNTLLYLKQQGFQSVNLGLAPLSGVEGVNLTEKAVKYAYENLKAFGNFKGLRKYKEKFFPTWEQKFLIYSHNYHLIQLPNAIKRVSEGS